MFVIFWRKEISSKAAFKILVKLTTGFNVNHILQAAFAQNYFAKTLQTLTDKR